MGPLSHWWLPGQCKLQSGYTRALAGQQKVVGGKVGHGWVHRVPPEHRVNCACTEVPSGTIAAARVTVLLAEAVAYSMNLRLNTVHTNCSCGRCMSSVPIVRGGLCPHFIIFLPSNCALWNTFIAVKKYDEPRKHHLSFAGCKRTNCWLCFE